VTPGSRMLLVLGSLVLFSALAIAVVLGGGFVAGVFPPNDPVELTLIPLDRRIDAAPPSVPPRNARMEIPEEYRTPDQTPPVAYEGPDGVWRFRD